MEPGQESNENEDELSFSEEERVLEECEEYEHQYNFRFEEPDKDFVSILFYVITDAGIKWGIVFFTLLVVG